MKAKTYTLISLVLSLAMCIMLSACANPGMNEQPDTPGEYEIKCSDYTLIGKNNEFFMMFDDINIYQSQGPESQVKGTIEFPTMKDFKDSVTKGLLTDYQKEIAAGFQKNRAGEIMTCDFDNLYIPTLPKNGVIKVISWDGQTYRFRANLNDEVWATISYMTKDDFDSTYQNNYLEFFNSDSITVTKTLDDGKIATYFTTKAGDFMRMRYTMTVGTKIITVDKEFRLRANSDYQPASSTVPLSVDLYITSGDKFCYISLYGFSEDPTDAWLSCFGLEKYIDETDSSASTNPGINEQPDTLGEYEIKCSDYTLIGKNNEFFVVFDDINIYQSQGPESQVKGTIDFPTMKDFKDSVTKGLLTDYQKEIAAGFEKNSAGAIMTCDFDNLYIPTLPKDCVASVVSWEGQYYSSLFLPNDKNHGLFSHGWFNYLTKDWFDSRYQEDYLEYFNNDKITVTKTQTLAGGKIATYYTTSAGEFMNVRYTMTVGTKVITVDKEFILQLHRTPLPFETISSTVPEDVDLYITSGDKFCHINLDGLSEDPTDAWLSRFGLEKYVD
ncbi:MAG: hypothetical protein IKC95_05610 [Oscillospiraceae bacterium]|nr:hypothetical protein [Oscillospiraceae bacterium]